MPWSGNAGQVLAGSLAAKCQSFALIMCTRSIGASSCQKIACVVFNESANNLFQLCRVDWAEVKYALWHCWLGCRPCAEIAAVPELAGASSFSMNGSASCTLAVITCNDSNGMTPGHTATEVISIANCCSLKPLLQHG